ncbi:MAG: hypothetical protein Solumvirus2_70 [Solumvirus sp.]|uniref:Uncharacterized protein n=1 Tax=Solumvirus sp. TaxID=2487773 RepID=A0A3G5AJR3_9VIRU|nr:MAG: hypothetical protein Solumvirus2_70 [Solumvirus sp.]
MSTILDEVSPSVASYPVTSITGNCGNGKMTPLVPIHYNNSSHNSHYEKSLNLLIDKIKIHSKHLQIYKIFLKMINLGDEVVITCEGGNNNLISLTLRVKDKTRSRSWIITRIKGIRRDLGTVQHILKGDDGVLEMIFGNKSTRSIRTSHQRYSDFAKDDKSIHTIEKWEYYLIRFIHQIRQRNLPEDQRVDLGLYCNYPVNTMWNEYLSLSHNYVLLREGWVSPQVNTPKRGDLLKNHTTITSIYDGTQFVPILLRGIPQIPSDYDDFPLSKWSKRDLSDPMEIIRDPGKYDILEMVPINLAMLPRMFHNYISILSQPRTRSAFNSLYTPIDPNWVIYVKLRESYPQNKTIIGDISSLKYSTFYVFRRKGSKINTNEDIIRSFYDGCVIHRFLRVNHMILQEKLASVNEYVKSGYGGSIIHYSASYQQRKNKVLSILDYLNIPKVILNIIERYLR